VYPEPASTVTEDSPFTAIVGAVLSKIIEQAFSATISAPADKEESTLKIAHAVINDILEFVSAYSFMGASSFWRFINSINT
jgi:hypothetical protein